MLPSPPDTAKLRTIHSVLILGVNIWEEVVSAWWIEPRGALVTQTRKAYNKILQPNFADVSTSSSNQKAWICYETDCRSFAVTDEQRGG